MWKKTYGSGWFKYTIKEPRINIVLDGNYARGYEYIAQGITIALAGAAVGHVVGGSAAAAAVMGGAKASAMAKGILSALTAVFDIKLLMSRDGTINIKLEYVPHGMSKVQLVKNGRWYMTGYYPPPYMIWMDRIPIGKSFYLP
jgi:hypothetical protein